MKWIIHIGRGKTGSSALQAFLDVNRVTLAERFRLLYPNTDGPPYDRGACHNHSRLIVHRSVPEAVGCLVSCLDFAAARDMNAMIVSSESPKPVYREIVRQVLAERPDTHPVVVVYVRRQDHLLEAAWKEWGAHKGANSFQTFLEQECPSAFGLTKKNAFRLDHKHLLELWSHIVSPKAISVRPYEQGQLRRGCVVADFLALLGVDTLDGLVQPPVRRISRNTGFHPAVLDLMQRTFGMGKGEEDELAKDLFFDAFGASHGKQPFQSYGLLSPQQRRLVLETFDEANSDIARQWLGREDGKLFLDPWPTENDSWTPFVGDAAALPALVFHLLAHMICQRHKTIAQLAETGRSGNAQGKTAHDTPNTHGCNRNTL